MTSTAGRPPAGAEEAPARRRSGTPGPPPRPHPHRTARAVPPAVPLRARRLPVPGVRGTRGRPRCPGRGADRLRQDRGGRVRRPPRPAERPQVLLHHAHQGAVQPEVRRPRPPLRRRGGRACSPATTPINGDAPVVVMTTEVLRNMLYAGSPTLAGPRLRGHGRGALPGRPVPRRGVGGGDHPPAGVVRARLAVGDRQQRRGVRRLARHRPRRHRGRGRGAPAGAAVAARAWSAAGCYDLFVEDDRARGAGDGSAVPRAPPGQPRTAASWPATTAGGRRAARGRERQRPPRSPGGRPCRAAPTSSSGSTAPACCPPSPSSSAGPAATPPSSSACARACA